MVTNRKRGAIYTGVTSNIAQRLWQHKNGLAPGYTKKYGVDRLVWFELHPTMESAITREKRLKWWKREWKVEMIEGNNPAWLDLGWQVV